MIGMNSISFLILLIISVAVSAILHYHFKYRDAWTLVVRFEGRRGVDRRMAGLASLWALA